VDAEFCIASMPSAARNKFALSAQGKASAVTLPQLHQDTEWLFNISPSGYMMRPGEQLIQPMLDEFTNMEEEPDRWELDAESASFVTSGGVATHHEACIDIPRDLAVQKVLYLSHHPPLVAPPLSCDLGRGGFSSCCRERYNSLT